MATGSTVSTASDRDDEDSPGPSTSIIEISDESAPEPSITEVLDKPVVPPREMSDVSSFESDDLMVNVSRMSEEIGAPILRFRR